MKSSYILKIEELPFPPKLDRKLEQEIRTRSKFLGISKWNIVAGEVFRKESRNISRSSWNILILRFLLDVQMKY